MPTFNGREIITIPSSPSSPANIEITAVNTVAMSRSPFTGQQQVHDWDAHWLEAIVTMPAMPHAQAQDWVTFLLALKGVANVFAFNAAFQAAFPLSIPEGIYWCLKDNGRKWSISLGKIYGFQFDIRQAL